MAYSSDKAQQQINSYAEFVESFRQTTAKRMAEFEQELAVAQKKAHEAAKKKRELPARASVAAEIGASIRPRSTRGKVRGVLRKV